jgi:hypothetical protein
VTADALVDEGDTADRAQSTSSESVRPGSAISEAIAEAYLIHAGTWIANMEALDSNGLKERVLHSGALTEDEWSWITTMVLSLA